MVRLTIACLLLAALGCKRVTSTRPDEVDAGPVVPNLEGTWSLNRILSSQIPLGARATPCPAITISLRPTLLFVTGTELATNGGRPVGNVTFFGAHHITFDEPESWSSDEGVLDFVFVYYVLDQASTNQLEGTATAIANWLDGSCQYEWNVYCARQ
jgi:hypothetical protein